MKKLFLIPIAITVLTSCGKGSEINVSYAWPSSGVAEADSLFVRIEQQRGELDYTLQAVRPLHERFCSIANSHPENEILKMRRLYLDCCTLLQVDNRRLRLSLSEGMSRLDSAASPYDWFMLRTLALVNEKSIYNRYRTASENVEFFKKAESDIGLAKNFEILGNVMCELNDKTKANSYYDLAEELYDKAGVPRYKYIMEIGRTCASDSEDEEIERLMNLLDNEVIRNNPALHSTVLQNAYVMTDSTPFLDEAIDIIKNESVDKGRLPMLYAYKAYNLLMEDDIKGALALSDSVNTLLKHNTTPTRQLDLIHAIRAEIYNQADMKDECIAELEESIWWTDSTANEANLPAIYAHESRKLIDVVEENNRLEKRNITLYWLLASLFAVVCVSAFVWFVRRKIALQRRELALLDEKIENAYNIQLAQSSILEQRQHLLNDIDRIIDSHTSNTATDSKLISELRRAINLYKGSENSQAGYLKVSLNVDNKFHNRLKADFPDLSESLLRLAALIASGIDSHQLAATLNISPKSLYTSRYRLRTRLGLTKDDSLEDFLRSYISQQN